MLSSYMLRFSFGLTKSGVEQYLYVVRELLKRSVCVVETSYLSEDDEILKYFYHITCIYARKNIIAFTRIDVKINLIEETFRDVIDRSYEFRIAFTIDPREPLNLDEFEKQLLAFASAEDLEPLLRPM